MFKVEASLKETTGIHGLIFTNKLTWLSLSFLAMSSSSSLALLSSFSSPATVSESPEMNAQHDF